MPIEADMILLQMSTRPKTINYIHQAELYIRGKLRDVHS